MDWARLHKSFLQLYSGRDSEITTIAGPCVNVLCVYNSSKISVLTFPEFYDLQEIDPKYCQLIETPVNFGNCTLMLKFIKIEIQWDSQTRVPAIYTDKVQDLYEFV